MTAGLDIGPLVAWASALSILLSCGTAVWTLLTSGARRNDKRLEAADKRMEECVARVEVLERQLQRHEDKLAQMPDITMMHRLELSLTRMEGHIDRLDERLKPVAAIAERMQELMIEDARGKSEEARGK